MIPWLTLPNSIKSVFVVSSMATFANVRVNFSLSAPGAFSLFVPCALSLSVPSPDESIIDSSICTPTLKLGLPEYFSNTIVCFSTLTKKPLVNITPSLTEAIDALPLGVSVSVTVLKWLLFELSTETVPLPSVDIVTT